MWRARGNDYMSPFVIRRLTPRQSPCHSRRPVDLRNFFLAAGAPLRIYNRATRHERPGTIQHLINFRDLIMGRGAPFAPLAGRRPNANVVTPASTVRTGVSLTGAVKFTVTRFNTVWMSDDFTSVAGMGFVPICASPNRIKTIRSIAFSFRASPELGAYHQ